VTEDSLWIFGYGSLLWDPGFPVAERVLARLEGYHRSFCMLSFHYRGSREDPGLVLALDRQAGAFCEGVAMRPPAAHAEETLAYLRARELVSDAYKEVRLPVTLADGRRLRAVTYVIDRAHEQYCGRLDPEAQAEMIARARGRNGPNRDYLWNTVAHLEELGIADPDLSWLARRVRELAGDGRS